MFYFGVSHTDSNFGTCFYLNTNCAGGWTSNHRIEVMYKVIDIKYALLNTVHAIEFIPTICRLSFTFLSA